jgi:hypothetical protein
MNDRANLISRIYKVLWNILKDTHDKRNVSCLGLCNEPEQTKI